MGVRPDAIDARAQRECRWLMTTTPFEATQWRQRRRAFFAVRCVLFAAIAFWFGPNLIMFGKLTWLSPADFVPAVQRDCVPVVRAMKAYERDHGHRPEELEELVPSYLPA